MDTEVLVYVDLESMPMLVGQLWALHAEIAGQCSL